jgi:methionyl-tRNA synthetase
VLFSLKEEIMEETPVNQPVSQPAAPAQNNLLTIDEFKKIQLKVGRIKEVTDHPNADKLYVISVDMGDKTKQLVAGIRQKYSREELMGKLIVVVDNLAPAVLRGVESQGMLLAASDADTIAVLTVDRPVALGSRIK